MRKGLMAAAVLALAGCAAGAGDGPGAAGGVPAGEWRVVSAGAMTIAAGDGVTLEFADGGIAGRGGCNRYAGQATITPAGDGTGRIALPGIVSTRMACPGRAMQVEHAYLRALERVDGYRLDLDGSLTLTAGGAPLIRARRP